MGAGAAARGFVTGLAATDSTAVSVASRNQGSAREFAAAHRIERVFATYADAIATGGVDAFYVATPPGTHRELATKCTQAGIPVLVEKPMASTAADAEAIADEARRAGVFCMVALWTRFLPAITRARHLIDEGELGEIRMASGSFGLPERTDRSHWLFDPELGGGALLDRAVYPVSVMTHLLGVPESVSSDVRYSDTGVDEQVTLALRFAGGVQATALASMTTHAPNDMVILGTRGTLRIHPPIYRPYRLTLTSVTPRPRTLDTAPAPWRQALTGSALAHRARQYVGDDLVGSLTRRRSTKLVPYEGNGYSHEAREVIECVRRGDIESPLMPLDESVAVARVLDEARACWA